MSGPIQTVDKVPSRLGKDGHEGTLVVEWKRKAAIKMMTREAAKRREQMEMFCLDDLVPKDHLVRKIEAAIDWSFIYELIYSSRFSRRYCQSASRRGW